MLWESRVGIARLRYIARELRSMLLPAVRICALFGEGDNQLTRICATRTIDELAPRELNNGRRIEEVRMVTINGEAVAAEGKSLSEYLAEAGYVCERVAVELNGDIVPKSAYDDTRLSAGDEVEIVAFVGGG